MRALFLTVILFSSYLAQAQLDDILKKAEDTLSPHNTAGLSNDKIVAGLKEALEVSTGKAVALTGRPDGFLKNQAIKILLPPKLETVGKGMRMLGMGASRGRTRSRHESCRGASHSRSEGDFYRGGEEDEFR